MATPPNNAFPDQTIVVKPPKTSDPKFEFEVNKTASTNTIYAGVLFFEYVKSDGSTTQGRSDHDNRTANGGDTFNIIFDVSKIFLEKEWKASSKKVLKYTLEVVMRWENDGKWNVVNHKYTGNYQPNPDGSFESNSKNTIKES